MGFLLCSYAPRTFGCQRFWKESEMYIGGGLIGTILIVLLVLFVLGRI